MMVRFQFEAWAEFEAAACHYEQHQLGLGERFIKAVEEAIEGIAANPKRWPVLGEDVHRRLVRIFPYAVLYTIEPRHVLIVAVSHLHRQPFYWRYRS